MKPPRIKSQMSSPLRRSAPALQGLLLLCLVAAPAEVFAQDRLCFRNVTGLPGTPADLKPDGVVAGDPIWNNAFRYVFENGTNTPHAAVQGLRSDTHLYFSFEVNNDKSFDTSDVIVVTFKTEGPNGFHRIHLYPLPSAVGNVTDNVVGGIDYFTGTASGSTITWKAVRGAEKFITAKLATSGAGIPLKSWSAEMLIKLRSQACCITHDTSCCDAIALPREGDFGFFFAILRVDWMGTPLEDDDDAVPFEWPPRPPGAEPMKFWEIETTTPPLSEWGLAHFGDSGCGGLSFSPMDIHTNNKPDSLINIKKDSENIFSVKVRNDRATPAEKVSATFKIANFGITDSQFGPWALLNATMPPAQDIPGGTAKELETGKWVLSKGEITQYDKNDTTRHQCIRVELNANPGPGKAVDFVNRSAQRNMDFGLPASVFERAATIDTRGFSQRVDEKPLPGCKPIYRMELVTSPTVREQVVSTPDGVQHHEEMNLLYHGYLQTNRIIRIKDKDYRVKLPVASYGYNVVHSRPATDEEQRLARSGEKPMVAQNELAATAREPFKPEELIPGQHWNVATTLDESSRPPTPPNCPGLKVTIPPANRPGEEPKSQVITMEIPQDEVVQLGTRAEYQDKPTQPPAGGCGCRRTGQTAGSAAMLGLLALGFLSSRRKRGKHD